MSDLGAAENFVMDPVEAEQNCTHSLRNMRERTRRQENSEQDMKQTRNASLRSRRQQERVPNSLNEDKPEMTVLDRGERRTA